MRYLTLALLLLLACVPTRAATNIITGDYATVSAAYTAAVNGDTLMLLPGTYVWTARMNWNLPKSINLIGYGTNVTRIISTNVAGILQVTDSSSTPFQIAGICWIGHVANTEGIITIGKNVPAAVAFPGFARVTENFFQLGKRAGVVMGYGGGRGLGDNNYFVIPSGVSGWNAFYAGGNNYSSWADSNPFGTTNAVWYEDNYSLNLSGNAGNGHWDSYTGSQIGIRFNTFVGTANNGGHGYDSQVTSTRSTEFYGNVLTNLDGSAVPIETRGGAAVFYSNRLYSATAPLVATNGAMYLNYYRSCLETNSSTGFIQNTSGYMGHLSTNSFAGTATGGSSTTLVDTNRGDIAIYGNVLDGTSLLLVLTGGTGAGQSLTVSGSTTGGIINVSGGTFSPAPDNTTTYELRPQNNTILTRGNANGGAAQYTFKTVLTPTSVRQVLVGVDLASSISNLVSCIQQDPAGSNILWSGASGTVAQRNQDFYVYAYNGTTMYLTNRMDGPNAGGYPGAMANGMINVTQFTNSPATLYGSFSWANTLNGTNVGFIPRWEGQCTGLYDTNALVAERDYFNDSLMPPGYVALTYPHPARSTLYPDKKAIVLTASTNGVNFTTTPDFNTGATSVAAPGTNRYILAASITLTAPPAASGATFSHWERDAVTYTNTQTFTYTVDQPRTFNAVFTNATPTVWVLTIQSERPSSGLTVTNTVDNSGATNTVTPGVLFYNDLASVTLTAPTATSYGRFKHWLKDGVFNAATPSINVTATADATYKAVYRTAQEVDGNVIYSGNILLQ